MKRVLFGLAAALTISGCGMYTNFPAQIHIVDVKGATLTYGKPDATDGWRDIKVDPPEITLAGEPGSIGVTFEEMKIDYFQINGARVPTGDIPPMTLRVTTRVESSVFPTDPLAGPVTTETLGKQITVGQTKIEPPVVTRHVTAYGQKTSDNAAAVWAQVQFVGTDDAGFPLTVTAYVPVTFVGPPGTGK